MLKKLLSESSESIVVMIKSLSKWLCLPLSLFVFASCGVAGTSSAGPPVVILGETITVSSLSDDGLINITGAKDSADADAFVVATVTSASASLTRTLGLELNQETSSGCLSSSLPACPAITDGSCYAVATTEGRFTLDIPAAASDAVAVKSIEPTSCSETDIVAGRTIPQDVPPLNMDATAFTYFEGYYYTLGTREDIATILKLDLASPEVQEDVIINNGQIITGELADIAIIPDPNGVSSEAYVILNTTSDIFVGLLSADHTAIAGLKSFFFETETGIAGMKFQTSLVTEDMSCETESLISSDSILNLVFTAPDGRIALVRDFISAYAAAEETITLSDETPSLGDSDTMPVVVFIKPIENRFAMVVSYGGAQDPVHDYYITSGNEQNLVCDSLSFKAREDMIFLGLATRTVGYNNYFSYSELDLGDSIQKVLSLTDQEEKHTITVFVDEEGSIANTTVVGMSELDFPENVTFGATFLSAPYVNDDQIKLLTVNNLGENFFNFTFNEDLTDIGDFTKIDSVNNIINPVDIDGESDLDSIIVLDNGNSSDDRSNINLYSRDL